MRVISKRGLWLRAAKYADARTALQVWLDTVSAARWTSLDELRRTFPATDMIGKLAIFNIRGNRYMLIVRMEFSGQRVYVKDFLSQAEYDKGSWKRWL